MSVRFRVRVSVRFRVRVRVRVWVRVRIRVWVRVRVRVRELHAEGVLVHERDGEAVEGLEEDEERGHGRVPL